MERYEYLVEYLEASREEQAAYLQTYWPEIEGLYPPQSLIPLLNARGEAGWELIEMHPYIVGMNQDVLLLSESRTWTHAYLCVWKRPAARPAPPAPPPAPPAQPAP